MDFMKNRSNEIGINEICSIEIRIRQEPPVALNLTTVSTLPEKQITFRTTMYTSLTNQRLASGQKRTFLYYKSHANLL